MHDDVYFLQCDVHSDRTSDLRVNEHPGKSSLCFSHHPLCLLCSANLSFICQEICFNTKRIVGFLLVWQNQSFFMMNVERCICESAFTILYKMDDIIKQLIISY